MKSNIKNLVTASNYRLDDIIENVSDKPTKAVASIRRKNKRFQHREERRTANRSIQLGLEAMEDERGELLSVWASENMEVVS